MRRRVPAALAVTLLALGATAADARDSKPPQITHLHAAGGVTCPQHVTGCTSRPAVITFTLSEKATVFMEFERASTTPGVGPELFRARQHAFKGRNTVRAFLTESGHYQLAIIAADAARNASRPGRTHFTQHRF